MAGLQKGNKVLFAVLSYVLIGSDCLKGVLGAFP